MKFRLKQLILWHIGLCVLFIYQEFFKGGIDHIISIASSPKHYVVFLTTLIAFFLYPLSTYWILFRYYKRKPIILLLFGMLCSSLIAIRFRYILQEDIQQALIGFGNYNPHTTFHYYLLDNVYYAIVFSTFGAIFFFVQYSQHKELSQKELIVQNKQSELTLLRSQVNPHFLFNTLNNIYTLVYQKSDQALSALEQMTELLRYALYEQKEKVLIAKELQAIQSFINLEKIRFGYPINIELDIDEQVQQLKIAPFILIPFIENAFKHGNLKHPTQALTIQLNIDNAWLNFKVSNEISDQQKDSIGGIGLENVQKRLDIIYGPDHQLVINRQDHHFITTLKIALSAC